MLKVYYAHPMSIYNTPQEDRDIELLQQLGFEVVNPNQPEIAVTCMFMRERGMAGDIMSVIFKPMVEACDALAFRAFPDGSISAGVAQEIGYLDPSRPVFELPRGLLRRALTVAATREVLAELGQR